MTTENLNKPYTPYTYVLHWILPGYWYYGVRYSKKNGMYGNGCHPDDLFLQYFTSSKLVKRTIGKYGYPDTIEVRRTFTNDKSARDWEHKVLRRMNISRDKQSLNVTNNYGPPIPINPSGGVGRPKGIESKIKGMNAYHIPRTNVVKYFSKTDSVPSGFVFGGRPKTEEEIKNISTSKLGYRHSQKSKLQMSINRKGTRLRSENFNARITTIKGKSFNSRKEAFEYFEIDKVQYKNYLKFGEFHATDIVYKCPNCEQEMNSISNFNRWHGENCNEREILIKGKSFKNRKGAFEYFGISEKQYKNYLKFGEFRAIDIVYKCPHCRKETNSKANFNRWHGDNCKKAI